jgi:serine protease inhibitor
MMNDTCKPIRGLTAMPSRPVVPRTLALALLLTLPACETVAGPHAGASEIRLPRSLSADEVALIHAGNSFAFDLLRQVPLERPDSPNVFLSPLSASMALGMAMNGAAGETWSQMRDALGFGGLEEPEINQAYHALIDLLRELDPRVEFGLANSVWARQGEVFYEDFLDRVRTYFDARVEALDFADPASLKVMNDWVADETHGRIEDLIDQIDPDAIMYLINAVYFNGDWVYQFDVSDTRPRPFHRGDGSTVTVDMMSMEADLRFHVDGDAAVLELPYGGRAFTAIAALPGPGRSVAELVAGLDAVVWGDWMARIEAADRRAAAVVLPKLELEYDRLLNEDLQALGMLHAFNEGGPADFSRMTHIRFPGDVSISRVQQNTFLKVDEKGTEAAAATYVEVIRESVGEGMPSFVFDHPFLFAIRERLSGTVLFIGVIGDPAA